MLLQLQLLLVFFFFNDTATTEIYTLSLHDALPISYRTLGRMRGKPTSSMPGEDSCRCQTHAFMGSQPVARAAPSPPPDRKSTRLNSSHGYISYAVFCLKKKKKSY